MCSNQRRGRIKTKTETRHVQIRNRIKLIFYLLQWLLWLISIKFEKLDIIINIFHQDIVHRFRFLSALA